MSEAIVIWIFVMILQQQGMVGGQTSDKDTCESSRVAAITEARAMGQEILAVSECQQITSSPLKKA